MDRPSHSVRHTLHDEFQLEFVSNGTLGDDWPAGTQAHGKALPIRHGRRQLTAFARHSRLTTDDGHMLVIARSHQNVT
jgi:hypothetical protein